MVYQITSKQAQHIVNKMMKDIPYNINIMNEKGIIIGSGKKDRLGTLHTGAVKALQSGKMITITADNRNVKKGTNEPIVIGGRIVGVIGISGEPEEVIPFCKLVKTTVSLLIEQEITLKNIEKASKKKSAFLKSLLNENYQYSEEIKEAAKEYDMDLTCKTAVLITKMDTPIKMQLKYPIFIEDGYMVIMVQNQDEIQTSIRILTNEYPEMIISVGNYVENVSESYNQAMDALHIKEKLRLKRDIIFFNEVALLVKISKIDIEPYSLDRRKKEILENNKELMDTLMSFISNNCSVSLTAQELHIHRNTLQYRLNRIKEITGNDPKQLLGLFKLICVLINQ